MSVTFGIANRLLHHIEPFQFIDSPEWYMMQNASSQDAKASKPQVKLIGTFVSISRTYCIFVTHFCPVVERICRVSIIREAE